MSLKTALIFLLFFGGIAAIDYFFLDWSIVVFVAKQLFRITNWIAFWR